jgi:hypothetical protein
MTETLADAAAELITELPDTTAALTLEHLKRLHDLRISLLAVESAALATVDAICRAMDRHGLTSTRHLNDRELADLDRAERLLMDTERAAAALDGWEGRSGWSAFAGLPPKGREITVSEDLDGGLILISPPEDDEP